MEEKKERPARKDSRRRQQEDDGLIKKLIQVRPPLYSQIFHVFAARVRNVLGGHKLEQTANSGFNAVYGIGSTVRFRSYVLNACRFHNRTYGAAGITEEDSRKTTA